MLTAKSKNIEFTLPSAWFEVTIKQFVDLYPKRKTNDEGATYLDPYDTAKALVSDIAAYHASPAGEIERMLEQWLPVLGPMPDWPNLEVPFVVAGVKPPTEIGTCTQLQVESAKMIISDQLEEEGASDYVLLSVPLIAIFLYPLLAGKPLTDTDQIEEIIPLVETIPVTEGLPLAAFFFEQLNESEAFWSNEFRHKLPKRAAENIADEMVPELEAYLEAAIISTVGKQKRITDEAAQQLPYDEFMSTLAMLHHQARWQYEYNQAVASTTKT